jgi:hypothetical protein
MQRKDGLRSPWWQRIDWFTVVGAILSAGFVVMVLAAIQGATT